MPKKPKNCDCIDQINEQLKEHNMKISRHIVMNFTAKSAGLSTPMLVTEKLDSKKRGVKKTVYAAYCPCCGKKYQQ